MAHSLATLIRRLIWLLIGLALIVFAVSNRHITEISFSPVPYGVKVPVWAVLFTGIFIGLLIASFVTGWLRLKGFTARRKAERRAEEMGAQMSAMAEDSHKIKAAHAHEQASSETLLKNP